MLRIASFPAYRRPVSHDALLLDCAEQVAPEAETALTGCMTEAWQRLFPEAVMPGICEAHSGHSWAEAKE